MTNPWRVFSDCRTEYWTYISDIAKPRLDLRVGDVVRLVRVSENRFQTTLFFASSLLKVFEPRWKTTGMLSRLPRRYLGTETGFQKVSRCPRSVSLGRKYPIPVSKIKYELFRKSFRRPKSDQEIRLIYRWASLYLVRFLRKKYANSARTR